jgi:hypothetical protein
MVFVIKTRESTIRNNGTKIVYSIKTGATNEEVDRIKDFFRQRILKNEDITTAEPGLYTWILKTDGNFYATKTFTKQELGTLHVNLKVLTNTPTNQKDNIYAAGELEITDDNTILFNLLSGSYMARKLKTNPFSKKKLIEKVNDLFQSYGLSSKFLESANSNEEKLGGKKLIEGRNIRTSNENIGLLNDLFERKQTIGGTRKRRFSRRKTIKRKSENLK